MDHYDPESPHMSHVQTRPEKWRTYVMEHHEKIGISQEIINTSIINLRKKGWIGLIKPTQNWTEGKYNEKYQEKTEIKPW